MICARSVYFHLHSFTDDFYQYALVSFSVKLTVENLFPGAEVKLSLRHGTYTFAAYDRALQVCIGIVLKAVVLILVIRLRSQLEKSLEIPVQTALVVIYKNTGCDALR